MKKISYQFFLLLLLGFTSQLSAEPQGAKSEPYRLRDGDHFRLTVFQRPDLTKSLSIDQDGKVSLPTIQGAIPLRGLTLKEAEQKIRESLAEGRAKFPPMALAMLRYAREFVHVSGEIHRPGPVELPLGVRMDLETALAVAGGISPFADPDAIELVTADGVSETWTWEKIRGAKEKRLLSAGDQIIVSKGPLAKTSVSIEGRVEKHGLVTIPKRGKLDLATALLLAGGPSSYADLSRIEVIPADGSKPSYFQYEAILREAILKGDSGKTLLKPGDRVRVHESRFVGLGVTLSGAVMNEGFQPFPLDGRLDLVAAIARAGGFNRDANKKKVFLTRDGKTAQINAMELIMEMRKFMLQPGDLIEVAK